ncbi:radical SAM protein [Caldanaerobacter subterraneus]|uniref:Fe-S oxidoreductase n=1 Tax=Caldanaerobacter subterraneus subsp. pacificus DSM 12653 TaxID=391606 RepID=A0A0F5PLN6_9THEO|nr:radical SAM protein [Caldanaerobacter subterraneus]KKC29321.1 Fe-S oxidoreductase [Caldanaerobacter subterraneus subsp. pacificus DSM 12653]
MNVLDPIVSTIINYVEKDPEKNLDTIANLLSKLAIMPQHKQQIEQVKRFLNDKNSNWYRYAVRLLKNIDKNIIKTLGVNFFIYSGLKGIPKQKELEEKYDINIPWAILMDPTEACNLRCVGCWAGQYKPHNLSFEVMDRVCTEAEELGIYFIVLSGGEPTVRMKDIIKLAERHKNQVFHLFTNGTLIDEDMIKEVKRVGNITFAVSINGFRETNDAIRGQGTFDKVMRAMDLMRENGVLFGYSATYTRTNVEEVSSDEFVDMMIDKGAAFAWYFTYIPIGRDPDISFMVTPEQRKYMYERINYIRATKELFAIDFWNDGEYSGGCIAGGRRYLHINAAGEVEPCAFIHYSNVNINEVSLLEALQSPIMKAYRKRQPFNSNHLRPCPLIDNPEKLLEIVREPKAKHTEASEASHIENLYEDLRVVADNWGKVADEIWEEKMAARTAVKKEA